MAFDKLATKYLGPAADDYNRVRAGRKWDAEHEAVAELLTFVPEGSAVLDIPVGTGRLFPYFDARGFDVWGVDISADMLAHAHAAAELGAGRVQLKQADIRSAPFPNGSFDLVVCLRFLNMIDGTELQLALQELSRLSRDKLLIGIRYVTPYSDLRANCSDLGRLLTRPVRLARWLVHRCFGSRHDVVAHDKRFICELLAELGLDIVTQRYVERRWDNTDYLLWLLQKQRGDGSNGRKPISRR